MQIWEAIIAVVGIVDLVATILMGLAIYTLTGKTKQIDDQKQRMDSMEVDIQRKTAEVVDARMLSVKSDLSATFSERCMALERLIETKAHEVVNNRFAIISSEFKLAVGQLSVVVGEMDKRLARGDQEFKDNDDDIRRIELKVFTQMAEKCATREDVAQINNRIGQLENAVTRLAAGKGEHGHRPN